MARQKLNQDLDYGLIDMFDLDISNICRNLYDSFIVAATIKKSLTWKYYLRSHRDRARVRWKFDNYMTGLLLGILYPKYHARP